MVYWGHASWLIAIAFAPDWQTAVSVNRDKTLCVWDVATGALVAIYPIESAGRAVAVPVGNRIVVGTDKGQLHFLSLRNWPQ